LPAHYAQVIDEKQRDEIYKIQEEYQPKIEALQSQLNALKKERDEKISAVLTAEQKKQVDQAAAKRKSKDAPSAKPVEQPPTNPPTAPSPEK
jgi:Spy/CpxP family protein refolding chaperone